MNSTDSFESILESISKFQLNVALILEAEALQAEKSRNWICNHLSASAYPNNQDCITGAIDIQEQLHHIIEGISRMERALAKNLEILVRETEPCQGPGGRMHSLSDMGGFEL